MNVPTANVVISFDRDTMKRLFAEGATYQSLVAGITNDGTEGTLLFNHESNPNFISFEHSLNYGNSMVMKLDLIDPTGEFEERFISAGVVSNIVGYDYKKKNETANNTIDVLDARGVKISTEGYSKEAYADVKDFIKERYNTRELFIAYGTGNNLDLWSGPHRVVVTGAKLEVKGARKISLQLTPTPNQLDLNNRRGGYNEKANLNLRGMNVRCSGRSKDIIFVEDEETEFGIYDPLRYLQLTGAEAKIVRNIRQSNLDSFTDAGLEELKSALGEIDMHSLVVDALRNYIQNATGNQNVIVLLPNINLLCRKIINEVATNVRKNWFERQEQTINQLGELIEAQQAAAQAAQVEESPEFQNEVSVFAPADEFSAPPKTNLPSLLSVLEKGGTDLSKKENITGTSFGSTTASLLNTNLISSEQERISSLSLIFVENLLAKFGLITQISPKDQEVLGKPAVSYGEIGLKQYIEKAGTSKKRFDDQLKKNSFYALIQESSSKGLPDHKAVVTSVLDKIKENARGEYEFNIGYTVETDTNILDIWTKNESLNCSKFPLFGGYKNLDPTQEVIIVGDVALVKQYLYGQINLQAVKERQTSVKVQSIRASKHEVPVQTFIDDEYQIDPGQTRLEDKSNAEQIRALGSLEAQKVIPLHPLDRLILANSEYNETIYEQAYPPILNETANIEGAFGDVTKLPDDFGFAEDFTLTDFIKKNVEGENRLPFSVFRYNTSNPNVLDMTFNFGGTYLAALKTLGFKKVVSDIGSAVVNGVLPFDTGSFPIKTEADGLAYLKMQEYSKDLSNKKELIQKLGSMISPDLAQSMKLDPQEIANNIAGVLDELQKNPDLKGTMVEIDQLLPGDPFSAMSELVQDLYQKSLQLSIKTLPSFHISKTHSLSDYCLLFAQDSPVLQGKQPDRSALNAFFSGLYQIVGFKHKIDNRGAHSEFKLIKNYSGEAPRRVPETPGG